VIKVRDTRSLTASELFDLRKRAVIALRAGRTQLDVAAALGVSRQAVARWSRAAAVGETGLQPRTKGRPLGGKLAAKHASRIIRSIVEHLPDDLGLPFHLWTREAIALLIRRMRKVQLSVWTVGRLLRQWGLTPQKPIRRAYERDPKSVVRWLAEDYPAIRALAHREHAMILWEDEMGLRSDAAVGRTYGIRGKTPVVPVAGRRFKCNMVAGISNRGKLFFMIFTSLFSAVIFVAFLRRLLRQTRRKVVLIADAHPVHRAKKTRAWLQRNKHRIKLFFLPPYSPELNPSEYLNQDVKSNTVRRSRPRDEHELMASVRGYLRAKQHKPQKVKAYFQAEPVRYASS